MTTLKTMVTDWIRLKTQVGDPATPATGFGAFYDKNKAPYYINSDGTIVSVGSTAPVVDGWYAASGVWSYSSADAPTFVISVNADVTGQVSVGMKIKLTQTTVKYFIVTAVGAYGGGVTLVTVYGGTDYTLTADATSAPYYSLSRVPLGFPMSPAKWSVTFADTTIRSQLTPTANTYYNVGSLSVSLPIGVWDVTFYGLVQGTGDAGNGTSVKVALSTANNSASDLELLHSGFVTAGAVALQAGSTRQKILTLASKTTYYVVALTQYATNTLYLRNDVAALTVRAQCAYL